MQLRPPQDATHREATRLQEGQAVCSVRGWEGTETSSEPLISLRASAFWTHGLLGSALP